MKIFLNIGFVCAVFLIETFCAFASDSAKEFPLVAIRQQNKISIDKEHIYTAILNPDCKPFSWVENGEFNGVLKEFAEKLFKKSEIKVKWLVASSRLDYWKIVNSGIVDIIVDSRLSEKEAAKFGYELSPIYMSTSISIVQKINSSGKIKKIGVMPKSIAAEKIRKVYGEKISVITYDSVEAGLNSVKDASCDALFLYSPIAKFQLRDENRFLLKSALVPYFYVNFHLAVKNNFGELTNSFNNSIDYTMAEEIQKLLLKYTVLHRPTIEFFDYFYAYPTLIISIVSSIVLFVLGLLIAIIILRSRQLKALSDDRHRISELLEEQKLTLLSIGEGVIVTDADGIVCSVNPECEKIIGYKASECIGKSTEKIFRLVSDTSIAQHSPIKAVLKSKKSVQKKENTFLVSKSGEKRNISVVVSPIIQKGELSGTIAVFSDITKEFQQRKTLSETLVRAETLNKSFQDMLSIHKTFSDNIPALIFAMDINNDFRYTSFNKTCLTLWGLDEKEAVGKNDFEIFGPEQGKFLRQSNEKVLQTDNVYEEILPFSGRDKVKRIGHFFRKKLKLSDGREWLIGIGIDITDIENAKKIAAENAEWLKLTINSITDGVITVDINNNIISVNKIAEKISGFSIAELIGKRIDITLNLLRFFNNQKVEFPTLSVLKTGKPIASNSDMMLMSYGKVRARITYRSAPIYDTNRKIVGAIFTFRNITEESKLRGRIQQAILQDSMLNAVLSTIPSQVFIKDALDDFKYKVANKNFLDYYKLNHDDVINHTDFEIFDKEVAHQLRKHDKEVCLTPGKPYRFDEDISFLRKRKEIFKSVKICFMSADKHPYLLGLCFDVTDISRMQLRLQKALNEAKSAANAKDYFFASMSHEIRTPLNVIIGLTELLGDKNISRENQKEYLSDITVAGNQLLALINDILDLSKLESGLMVFTNTLTNFTEIAEEVGSVFKKTVREKSIRIIYDIPQNLPLVYMDKIRLRQILFNLIGNAVKFTNAGHIAIRAAFLPHDDLTGTFIFEIEDTGIGISEEDQKNLFLPFIQAGKLIGTEIAANGTGLGLAIVKKMLDNMNGKISIKSDLGKGSTFRIIIDTIKYEPKTPTEDVVEIPKPAECRLNYRVLAVDDVKMNLKVIRALLEQIGCEVKTALSAKEAFEILDKNDIDFVLTDVWMPEINGSDLAKKIRSNPKLSKVIIAAVSADAANDHKFDIAIFDDIMTKPITREKLRAFFKKYDNESGK